MSPLGEYITSTSFETCVDYEYSQSRLGWHFRMLFQSSKLKARTSIFTETWQKRRSSFELWAFENVTPSGIGCTYWCTRTDWQSTHSHQLASSASEFTGLFDRSLLQVSFTGLFYRSLLQAPLGTYTTVKEERTLMREVGWCEYLLQPHSIHQLWGGYD